VEDKAVWIAAADGGLDLTQRGEFRGDEIARLRFVADPDQGLTEERLREDQIGEIAPVDARPWRRDGEGDRRPDGEIGDLHRRQPVVAGGASRSAPGS
jgi:hypothetical protein